MPARPRLRRIIPVNPANKKAEATAIAPAFIYPWKRTKT
jgi:hypothetical protein